MTNEQQQKNELSVITANVDGAVATMQKFQELKKRLLDGSDILLISGKPYIKRSGWRKLALAFNITTEIVSTFPIKEGEKIIGYTIEAKAIAGNGRFAVDLGSCELREVQDKNHHNCIGKATTRAINRSISDLVGGGELSAEELVEEETISEAQAKYIKDLQQKKGVVVITPIIKNVVGRDVRLDELSKSEAQKVIKELKGE